MSKIYQKVDDKVLRSINKILNSGGVISFPTETVYALAADPTDDQAVERIYQLKGRDKSKPLSLLVGDMYQASQIVELNEMSEKLAMRFFPGPLTIVLNKKHDGIISPLVNNGAEKIGVRMPDHVLTLKILKAFGRPLIGTSANLSGSNDDSIDPFKVIESFRDIDLILNLGKTEHQNFSTVVDATGDKPIILREGVIHSDTIFKALEP
jgi:L-threonylcarbamoyladenylate synthase